MEIPEVPARLVRLADAGSWSSCEASWTSAVTYAPPTLATSTLDTCGRDGGPEGYKLLSTPLHLSNALHQYDYGGHWFKIWI